MKRTVLKQLPDGLRRLVILKRWLKKNLAKVEGHFDMRHWTLHRGRHGIREYGEAFQPRDLVDCGTVACLAGWATVVPQLRKEGLKVERREDLLAGTEGEMGIVTYMAYVGYDACRAFFGTSDYFKPEMYGVGSPNEVLNVLEERVKILLLDRGFTERE